MGGARRIKDEEEDVPGAPPYNDDIITLACLLHDVGDRKYLRPEQDATMAVHDFLISVGADESLATTVQGIASHVSYSSEMKDPHKVEVAIEKWPELAIVQDADRLDSIGAVGVGRCFTYNAVHLDGHGTGGMDAALQHFDEKLVKVGARMKTVAGRRMAVERTQRLEIFQTWWKEENGL